MTVVLSSQIQRFMEIVQFINLRYDDQGFGRVMSVTRETRNFDEEATAYSFDYFRWITSKTSDTVEKHIDSCEVGAGDWLVHNVELGKDCGFADCQSQHRANLMLPPANMTQMISIVEHFWVVLQKSSTGRIHGGNTHLSCGIKLMITMRGSRVFDSNHRTPLWVVATLVLPVHQMAE